MEASVSIRAVAFAESQRVGNFLVVLPVSTERKVCEHRSGPSEVHTRCLSHLLSTYMTIPEGHRSLEKLRPRWKDNIRTHFHFRHSSLCPFPSRFPFFLSIHNIFLHVRLIFQIIHLMLISIPLCRFVLAILSLHPKFYGSPPTLFSFSS
jgi:hypothetical protein